MPKPRREHLLPLLLAVPLCLGAQGPPQSTTQTPSQTAAPAPSQSSAPAVSQSVSQSPMQMPAQPQTSASVAQPADLVHYPTLDIQGFADVDFSAQNNGFERVGTPTGFTPPGTSSDFSLGQFVLHFAGSLSDKVSYYAEVSWTPNNTGFTTTIERSIIQYAFNDYLKLSAGRYHTPIMYWNTAYHHGLWLQTTINRPEMIQFGGSLIPVHFVGLLAEGTVPGTGSLNLQYDAGIGNGRGADISEPGNAGDINNNKAWLATVYAEPTWAYQWQFGGSFYRDQIGPATGIVGDYGERIETARLVYTSEKPEFISEFANIQHTAIGGPGVWDSQAWYSQIAYRLPWFKAQWKPYYRFEYIHVPVSDPAFNSPADTVPSLAGSIIGARYDFSSYAAYKIEYRNSRRVAGQPRIQGIFMQTALVF